MTDNEKILKIVEDRQKIIEFKEWYENDHKIYFPEKYQSVIDWLRENKIYIAEFLDLN